MNKSCSTRFFDIRISNKPLLSLLKKHDFFCYSSGSLCEEFFYLGSFELPSSPPDSIAQAHQFLMKNVFPQCDNAALMHELQSHEQDFSDSYTYFKWISDDADAGFLYFNGIASYIADGSGKEFSVHPSVCRLNMKVLAPDSWKQFSAIDFKKYALPYDIIELIDQNCISLIMDNERRWMLPAEQFVEFCESVISVAADGQKDAIIYADVMAADGALTYWYFGGEGHAGREVAWKYEYNDEIDQRLKYPEDTLTPVDDFEEIIAQFGVEDANEETVLQKFGLI